MLDTKPLVKGIKTFLPLRPLKSKIENHDMKKCKNSVICVNISHTQKMVYSHVPNN